jgi:hypothetical protein
VSTISLGESFFGLLELDAAGKVLYYRREQGGHDGGPAPEMTGLNFFTDFASMGKVEAFREQFHNFSAGDEPARSFNLTLRSERAALRVRVLLGRIRKRSDRGSTKSILVHIREAP